MELSIFLAKAWGLYLLIIALAFLINKNIFKILLRLFENEGAVFASGVFNLMVGILMVLSHNIWTPDWRVIITLFGWIALAKGIIRLFWPRLLINVVIKRIGKLKDSGWISVLLGIALLLGLYLSFIGFTS